MPDWLVMRADRRPEEPAVRAWSATWTRAQLLEASDSLALALASEGAEPGARVAFLLADDAPAVALINAARRLGIVLVPLNRRATAGELGPRLATAGVSSLICDMAHADLARDSAGGGVAVHRIEALLAGAPCAVSPGLRDEIDLEAPALVVFTSGTTGRPKGAVLTHGNLAASAHAWANVLRPRETDRWLACLPLFHVAGLAIVTRAARWGVELQVAAGFHVAEVTEALDDGISHISLVPAQLRSLLSEREDRPVPPTLRAILLGGGPVPTDLLASARGAGYPVLTTYGMTETGSGIAVGGLDEATLRDTAAARALPGVELRVEPDGAADGSGEILVRSRAVFAGYVDDPAATAATLRDGWLHTGDFGLLDAAGLLRISDRRDDLIISGGENVHAGEIEAVLMTHPGVAEVAVVGLPDERWGTVPAAAVVLEPGYDVSSAELERHCRERLAGFKVPVTFERYEELPRAELGKMRRGAVRDMLSREGT